MTSLRRWRSIETKQSSDIFAFLSIDCIECIYLYENRRIKDKQKKNEKKNYTDLFGLVIVEDEEFDEDLFVSINDRCWSAKRASAAVAGVK